MFYIELLQPPKNNIQSGGYLFNNQIGLFLKRKGIGKLVEVESVNLIQYISKESRKNIVFVLDSIYLSYLDYFQIKSVIRRHNQKIILLLHLLPSNDLSLNVSKGTRSKAESREIEWIKESNLLIVVTGQNYKLELIKKGVSPSKIKVVTPGQHKLQPNYNVNHKEKLNYPVKGISVGSLSSRKNQMLLVNMLSKIKPELYRWTFIGNKDKEPKYTQKLVKKAKNINAERSLVFLDKVEHFKVLQALAISDLYISTSTKESYGMAVAEACYVGIPILTLDTGDMSNYIKHNYNGFLFPQENKKGMQNKLLEVIKDLDLLTSLNQKAKKYSKEISFSSWEKSSLEFVEACKIKH